MVLEHPAMLNRGTEEGGLYSAVEESGGTATPTTLRLIPYYAWANREPTAMQVWIPDRQA
jgi:hypothetical protein